MSDEREFIHQFEGDPWVDSLTKEDFSDHTDRFHTEPTDYELMKTYESGRDERFSRALEEPLANPYELQVAGIRAVYNAGRDSRPADGVWIDAGKAREVGVCIRCSSTEASCARSRIKCCPDCTHRDSRDVIVVPRELLADLEWASEEERALKPERRAQVRRLLAGPNTTETGRVMTEPSTIPDTTSTTEQDKQA